MITQNLGKILKENAYPGRGIVIGKSDDGKYAVTAYFIMGRSVNSRNRVFTATEDGIKTEAFDPSLLTDPHLIIYSPVRVLGNKTIVTNGDQTDTIYELMDKQMTFEQSFSQCPSLRAMTAIRIHASATHSHIQIPRQASADSSIHTWVTAAPCRLSKASLRR